MDIYIYDTDLTLQGVIDEIISFIWVRRYWSPGEFKLLIPFTPLNCKLIAKNNLIMKRGDKEFACINYIHIKKNAQGMEEIEAQGKFISSWLGKRILREQLLISDNTQNIINRLVNDHLINPKDMKRKLPLLEMEANQQDLTCKKIEYISEPFISLLLAVETLSKGAEIGFNIETDLKTKKHTFRIYKGKELTADQQLNPPCIFSQEFENIREQEFTNSIENLKNIAYVGGEEKEGKQRQIVEIGTTTGLERSEIFINATDITQTYRENNKDITMPLSQYLEILKERGIKDLEQYAETLNFNSNINAMSNLIYKTDFDIGDKVTCIDNRWKIKMNVRITEITEIYQQTRNAIEVIFGESLPTLFDKLNKMK